MHSDFPNWMMPLAGSGLKTEGDHLNIKIVAALLICNANTLISCLEMCDLIITKLKIHPAGMATLKIKIKFPNKPQSKVSLKATFNLLRNFLLQNQNSVYTIRF